MRPEKAKRTRRDESEPAAGPVGKAKQYQAWSRVIVHDSFGCHISGWKPIKYSIYDDELEVLKFVSQVVTCDEETVVLPVGEIPSKIRR